MAHSKISYIVSHGLGPYFLNQMVTDVLDSNSYFTLHFDETVTNQSQKQLDILIRYFSATSQKVKVRFVYALLFGHAYADRVVSEMEFLLTNLKLPLAKLLAISSDGPNVNKSIKNKLYILVKQERTDRSGLVHTGFCVLHVIHNSFKEGNKKFGTRSQEIVVDVYHWFHMYPAREEDFLDLASDEIEDEEDETDNGKFLRHVDSRWLTLLPALMRIKRKLLKLVKYFTVFLPTSNKKLQSNARFRRIHTLLKDERKELEVEISFLI